MTTTSYNGWPASENPTDIGVIPLVVHGIEFPGGVRGGDVHTVLEYVATRFHEHVEPLVSPGCWGWSYRPNRNNPNTLSCHASATAVDCNAPKHPNGDPVSRTFTQAQIDGVHHILASIPELNQVVHWGGDWTAANGLVPDSMHFEIHNHDLAMLHRVATAIKEASVTRQSPGTIFRSTILSACTAALKAGSPVEIPARRRIQRAAVVAIRSLARKFPTP